MGNLLLNIESLSKEDYSKMYILYYKKLFNYGKKFTEDITIIEDSIDEIFIFIWVNKQNLNKINSLNSYIFSSFRNNLFKKIKSLNLDRIRKAGLESDLQFSIESIIIQKEIDIEIKQQLKKAIQYLSSRQREAIFLRFYEGLSFEEISGIMNISVKGTYKLIARAIIKLKEGFSITTHLFFLYLCSQ